MEKQRVYCLKMDNETAIYLDIGSLCDSLEMELDELSPNADCKFQLWTKQMTDQEIEDLPEFEGF